MKIALFLALSLSASTSFAVSDSKVICSSGHSGYIDSPDVARAQTQAQELLNAEIKSYISQGYTVSAPSIAIASNVIMTVSICVTVSKDF